MPSRGCVADELVPAPKPYVARSSEEKQLDRLRVREDRILEKALRIVEDCAGAADIDGDEMEPPAEWVEEVGLAEAKRRFRVAKDARQSRKDAPSYLELQKSVAVGIVKARSAEPAGRVSLNFSFTLAAPPRAYDVIDVEPEEK